LTISDLRRGKTTSAPPTRLCGRLRDKSPARFSIIDSARIAIPLICSSLIDRGIESQVKTSVEIVTVLCPSSAHSRKAAAGPSFDIDTISVSFRRRAAAELFNQS
jgi:hypothetical protein